MHRPSSLAFALASTLFLQATAEVCTSGWLYPALGSYYNGTVDINIKTEEHEGCRPQQEFALKNTSYPAVLYMGAPAGIKDPNFGNQQTDFELTIIAWKGGVTDAPCSRQSSDIRVDFNTSDHTLGSWAKELAGGPINGVEGFDLTCSADQVSPIIPASKVRQFEIDEAPICGPGGRTMDLKWNMLTPLRARGISLDLESPRFDDKEAVVIVSGELDESPVGLSAWTVTFHGAIDAERSDKLVSVNDNPTWVKTHDRFVDYSGDPGSGESLATSSKVSSTAVTSVAAVGTSTEFSTTSTAIIIPTEQSSTTGPSEIPTPGSNSTVNGTRTGLPNPTLPTQLAGSGASLGLGSWTVIFVVFSLACALA